MKQKKLKKKLKLSIAVTSEGVQVESEGITQKETEKLINRLIKKHSNFMIFKKKNSLGSYLG
ncbi:hypothetical protein LCGC14_1139230 [marine sediment metagenome]|uniref:Uncharacterized protein n=1 Tax=marine sediment metagenome TaxID=412755 RepID=A0A0F9LYW9_9ZZZZ